MIRRICTGLVFALLTGLVTAAPAQASQYVVANTNDSGAGSLRQAILDANANAGPDTITFPSNATITLQSELTVSDDLTIDTNGKNVVLSGGDATRIFNHDGGDFYLSNITLTNGLGTSASVFAVSGQNTPGTGLNPELFMTDVLIKDSVSSGDNGALTVLANASATLLDVVFENNTGGAIRQDYGGSENLVSISHSVFRNNIMANSSLGVVTSMRHMTISSSVFVENQGNSVYQMDRNLTLTNSIFLRNSGYAVSSKSSAWGLVRSWGTPQTLIYNNTFHNNTRGLVVDGLSVVKNNIIKDDTGAAGEECSIYTSSSYPAGNPVVDTNIFSAAIANDCTSAVNSIIGTVAYEAEVNTAVSTMPNVILPIIRPYSDSLGHGVAIRAICSSGDVGSVDALAVIRSNTACDLGAVIYSSSAAPTPTPTPTPTPSVSSSYTPTKIGVIRFGNKSAKVTAKVKLQLKKLLPRLRTANTVELRMFSRLKGANSKALRTATTLNKKRLSAIKAYLNKNRVTVRLVNANNARTKNSKRAVASVTLWRTA